MRKLPNKPLEFLIESVDFPAEDAFTWEPVKNSPNNVATLHEFKEKYIREDKLWRPTRKLPKLNVEVGHDTAGAPASPQESASSAPTSCEM